MNWISVEDELPEFKKNVLCYLGKGEPRMMKLMVVAQYEKDKKPQNEWTAVDGFNATFVTHWMPLPELPK